MQLKEVSIERHPTGVPSPTGGGNWSRGIRETLYYKVEIPNEEIKEDVHKYAFVEKIVIIGGENHKMIDEKVTYFKSYGDKQLKRVI